MTQLKIVNQEHNKGSFFRRTSSTNNPQNVSSYYHVGGSCFNNEQIKVLHLNGPMCIFFQKLLYWIGTSSSMITRYGDQEHNKEDLYFFLAMGKLAGDCVVSKQTISRWFRVMYSNGIVDCFYETDTHRWFVHVNAEVLTKLIPNIPQNKVLIKALDYFRYNSYNNNKQNNKEEKVLFEEDELNIEKKNNTKTEKGLEKINYTAKAEKCVIHILTKYEGFFKTKVPKDLSESTKTFANACRAIQAMYDGTFTNSRFFPIDETWKNKSCFGIKDWRTEVKEVEGDWKLVTRMLGKALRNYKEMFKTENMPFKKEFLPKELDKWFYNGYGFGKGDGGISTFIESLQEPMKTREHIDNVNADKVFEDMDIEFREEALKLLDKCPKGIDNSKTWKHLAVLCNWFECVLDYDKSAGYWGTTSAELLKKFSEYIERSSIQVSTNTFDIEQALSSGAPLCWWIQEAITKHGLDYKIMQCVTTDDFYDMFTHEEKDKWQGMVF